jgi:hypothetical protein
VSVAEMTKYVNVFLKPFGLVLLLLFNTTRMTSGPPASTGIAAAFY